METELQIAYQYTEFRSIFWEIVLYWTSVSFGLMAAAHLASRHLHIVVIVLLTALYVSFSIWMGFAFRSNLTMINAFMADLEAMGSLESKGVAAILAVHKATEESSVAGLTFTAAVIGTFASTIAFVWYSHFRRPRDA